MNSSVAAVTEEENQKVVRFPKELPVPVGSVSYEISSRGQVVLAAPPSAGRQKEWIDFLDSIAAREPDHDFMSERPMNRIPSGRDLFADD